MVGCRLERCPRVSTCHHEEHSPMNVIFLLLCPPLSLLSLLSRRKIFVKSSGSVVYFVLPVYLFYEERVSYAKTNNNGERDGLAECSSIDSSIDSSLGIVPIVIRLKNATKR